MEKTERSYVIEEARKRYQKERGSTKEKGEEFVSEYNAPLSIGHGQTISQPLTVAFMLELLQPKKGDIISYHEAYLKNKYEKPYKRNITHFAIIKETKGTLESTIIESKWGGDGVFETSLYDVPDCYGNSIVIWKKEK